MGERHVRDEPGPRRLDPTRLERKLAQAELARRAGIERAHLSRVEAGVVDPGLVLHEKIAAAFVLALAELMKTVDEERERRQARPRRQGQPPA